MDDTRQSTDAYRRLRDAILDCELPPGALTTENDLAARLGCGKAAVRVALVRLEHEGLVSPQGRRGHLVQPITLGDVMEMFAVRAMLEAETARLAAGRVDPAGLLALEEACVRHGLAGQEVASAAFRAAHDDLHLAIAAAAGSARLHALLEHNLREVARLLHLALGWLRPEQASEHSHRPLIDALVRGDAEGAAAEARRHVGAAQQMVLRALFASPDLRRVAVPAA